MYKEGHLCRLQFRLKRTYVYCFTKFTVDQSKLTVNGSALSDTPNVRYLVVLYKKCSARMGAFYSNYCNVS